MLNGTRTGAGTVARCDSSMLNGTRTGAGTVARDDLSMLNGTRTWAGTAIRDGLSVLNGTRAVDRAIRKEPCQGLESIPGLGAYSESARELLPREHLTEHLRSSEYISPQISKRFLVSRGQ